MKKFLCELLQLNLKSQIIFDKNKLQSYLYDAKFEGCLPIAVVNIVRKNDVKKILQLCSKYNVLLYIRGNATGQTGGMIPLKKNSIILNFSTFNKILNFNPIDRIIEVESGVTIGDLNNYLEKYGLFFPVDPASKNMATIGGAIAENSGGLRAAQFGIMRNNVLAISGYLPDGSYLDVGSYTIKNSTGYSLKDLIIGSEGTLFIITNAVLKLLPIPEIIATYLVYLKGDDFFRFIDFFFSKGFQASIIEFVDRNILYILKKYRTELDIPQNVDFAILLEFDGYNPINKTKLTKLETFLHSHNIAFQKARNLDDRDTLWKVRRNLSPLLKLFGKFKFNEDVCIPKVNMKKFFDFLDNANKVNKCLKIVSFGHLGDGNIHVNILCDNLDSTLPNITKIRTEMFKLVKKLNGTISGEHGIGISKKQFMKIQYSPKAINLMKKIKKIFDEKNILNRGKLL